MKIAGRSYKITADMAIFGLAIRTLWPYIAVDDNVVLDASVAEW